MLIIHAIGVMAGHDKHEMAMSGELLETIASKQILRTQDLGLYESIRDLSDEQCRKHIENDRQYASLINYINQHSLASTVNNDIQILINGEDKFPLLLEDLKSAKDHIHFQYYIYESEGIGAEVGDILKQKAQEGVEVRFLYDAFGSKFLSHKFLDDLRASGVHVASYLGFDPRYPIRTLNNRNHRKIVVIDGKVSYLGGLNIADRYINVDSTLEKNPYYWRDTHLRIVGDATEALQYIFMGDWNFATDEDLTINSRYFPPINHEVAHGNIFLQNLSSGPEDDEPLLLLAIEEAIKSTKKELLIVTPYFIPSHSLTQTILEARERGVDVQLMIPGMTDAILVNNVARSYYRRLIRHGVKIWEYQPGFIHAKTIISDGKLSILGSANMDRRSFFLNFEVCTFVYDKGMSEKARMSYMEDRCNSKLLTLEEWDDRPMKQKVYENGLRVLAPLF